MTTVLMQVLADGVDEVLLSRLSSEEREQLRELLGRAAGGGTAWTGPPKLGR
ncbi:hypothetical protein [Sciscionella marina]|uniref:hypothetical protein n=1 Tax=Sciscionella marina TaxID=508770 RepID=UPI000367FCC5|nr:hypothetical protein [Sciscionella marina]